MSCSTRFSDASQTITHSLDQLEFLSRAFRRVGNAIVADELDMHIEYIKQSCMEIQTVYDSQLQTSLSFSKEMAGGLLKATLKGKIGG